MKPIFSMALALVALVVCSAARGDDVADLVKQLKNADSDVRRTAAKALADMGPDAKPAALALVIALKTDKDLFVRRFAAQAVGEVGADPKAAVPALAAAVKDGMKEGKKELTEAAIDALGKMGPTAVPPLVDVLILKEDKKPKEKGKKKEVAESEDNFAKRKAAQALAHLGKDAKGAVSALIATLKNMDARTDAAIALGEIGPAAHGAVETLKDLSKDKKVKDKSFKKAAAEAVKKIEAKS